MLTWLAPLIVFGLVVFVHELGHFLAAKAMGVYAPRFSIGFGPALWRKRWGETEYVLARAAARRLRPDGVARGRGDGVPRGRQRGTSPGGRSERRAAATVTGVEGEPKDWDPERDDAVRSEAGPGASVVRVEAAVGAAVHPASPA